MDKKYGKERFLRYQPAEASKIIKDIFCFILGNTFLWLSPFLAKIDLRPCTVQNSTIESIFHFVPTVLW